MNVEQEKKKWIIGNTHYFTNEHGQYYIYKPGMTYLFKPGIAMEWFEYVDKYNLETANSNVYFNTHEEAKQFLHNYLEKKPMYEEEINEVKTKISVLQKKLQELEKKQKEAALTPVERYLKENPFRYGTVLRTPTYLKVPLPIANDDWSFAAFEWVKDCCKELTKQGMIGVYPRHDEAFDAKYLYIKY